MEVVPFRLLGGCLQALAAQCPTVTFGKCRQSSWFPAHNCPLLEVRDSGMKCNVCLEVDKMLAVQCQ
jgi:hypothetical protein